MKTIETIFSYDGGQMKNGTRNGVIKEQRYTINTDHIVSIEPWEGTLLHEGRSGTQIVDVNGRKYLDDRTYDDFMGDLRYHQVIEK